MKTASELRIELANNQRTAKGRENWLKMAEQINSRDCWAEKAEHDNKKIGDVVNFTDATFRGNCVKLSMKEGKAFAFGVNSMVLVYRGKLRQVKIKGKGDL